MIGVLVVLAIADLVVGVSNDAVNFLNSAIGSKAISFKTIMVIASVGIFVGAVFSSGMMEVARKGIFIPEKFMFNEIMIIFMAVMITDILLLDFFNTLGMPTSTTVSIVFELLGAAIAMSIIKIVNTEGESIANLYQYINYDKAFQIIMGILLSVVIAFSVGALVQYVSRLVFSFEYQKKMKYFGAIFSGLAFTGITYFIVMKGLKGTPYYGNLKEVFEGNEIYIIVGNLIFWTLFSQLYTSVFKKNILVVVIGLGTFGLALAFSGNDLVNFIGVPMAAFHSYEAWSASGVDPDAFSMGVLADKVPTESFMLFCAGGIMVLTLWLSKKARSVAETEINLSRQHEGAEKFKPNLLSRVIVRGVTKTSSLINVIIPKPTKEKIDSKFKKQPTTQTKDIKDTPAFDLIRASVNLMVAGILISIATSKKLPLSTTYVTFMVAMGTSLADRAWGRESAVYRVAGVFKVIGGWFFTAFIAFIAAGTMAYIMYVGGFIAVGVLLVIVAMFLVRNYIKFKKEERLLSEEALLKRAESKSVQGLIEESASNIAIVSKRAEKIYSRSIIGLAREDLKQLKKAKKGNEALFEEIESLQATVFYFIKNLETPSQEASRLYIDIIEHLEDIVQSLEYVGKISYKHVNNNHRRLTYNQTRELFETQSELATLFKNINKHFEERSFEELYAKIDREMLLDSMEQKIQKQIVRTREEEESPKNTTLYFSLLTETKNLIISLLNLTNLYHDKYRETRLLKNDPSFKQKTIV